MTIGEKSAYLKGLAEGMNLDTEKAEGKLIAGLIDLVSEISGAVETIDSQVSELCDYVDELDCDLGELEEFVYLDDENECLCDCDDDEYELGEYDECDGECEGCSGCDDIFDLDEEGMRCIMCENCGDTICYDESLDPSEIICPACGKKCAESAE